MMKDIEKQKRQLEKERTRIMDIMVKDHIRTTEEQLEQREHINSMHRMKSLEDQYKIITYQLNELQKCEAGLKYAKIQGKSGLKPVEDFCSQLESLIEFHRRDLAESNSSMSIRLDDPLNSIEFTDEEGYGQYLDLHECYQQYINLEGIVKVDYATYVSTFDRLFDIPRERKNSEYCYYVKALLKYLSDYLRRIRPLHSINYEMKKVETEFEKQWKNGTFPGWPREEDNARSNIEINSESSSLSTWAGIKSSLMDFGLKYDGTIENGAQKAFGTKYKDPFHLDSLIQYTNEETGRTKHMTKCKKVAKLEAMAYRLCDLVSTQRVATIEKIQPMQSGTNVETSVNESEEEIDNAVHYDNISYN